MPSESDFDQLELINILSTAISGYGYLLIALKGTSWNLYFPLPPRTQLSVGFLLFLLGWCSLFIRYGVSETKTRRRS